MAWEPGHRAAFRWRPASWDADETTTVELRVAPSESRTGARRIDRAGQVMAALCVVHCLLLPLTIAVLPVIGLEMVADRRVERLLVLLAIAIGTIALVPSLLGTHRRTLPVTAFACGSALLLAAQFVAENGTSLERVLTLAGAITIAAAHTVNIRLCAHAHPGGPSPKAA